LSQENQLRLEQAVFDGVNLRVSVDGHPCFIGSKYLLLEFCLTAIMPLYRSRVTFSLPALTRLISHPDLLSRVGISAESGVTDNPVLVALAYQAWWSINGRAYLVPGKIPIPAFRDAETILRGREILSPSNSRLRGLLAAECERKFTDNP